MQLERIAAVVRPRRSWEAIDLGFQMAREWWRPILRSWLLTVAPFYFAVVLLFSGQPAWWAPLTVWWLKPIFERVPLYVLSRALFGAAPSVKEVWRTMPRLWWSQSFGALTFRRLDPMRAIAMPIVSLEGLRGAERRQRAAVLKRGDDGAASSWLWVLCFLFELAILVALVGLLELLRPEIVRASFWHIFTFLGDAAAPRWYYFLAMALYFVAMTVVEPFFVAGGFALYLNRRTQLEGWDVEIAFRRLAQRLGAILLTAGAVAFPVPEAAAQEGAPDRDPQVAIEEILADPEFGTRRTAKVWRPKDLPDDGKEAPGTSEAFLNGLMELVATAARILLGAGLAALVVAVAIAVRRKYRPPGRKDSGREAGTGPVLVAGLDVSREALPEDVVAEALRMWHAGRPEDALSLLYRGALAWLVDRRHLPARESWTEGDCLRHLEGPKSPVPRESSLVDFFARLTAAWLSTAYAQRPPADDEMNELASAWPIHFSRTPRTESAS